MAIYHYTSGQLIICSLQFFETLIVEFQVVEAALNSRIQRLEHRLMDLEPRVSMET